MRGLAGRLSPPVSAQAISKYEGGRMMPSSAVLVGLAGTLDVSLDFLMGGQVETLDGIEFRRHSRTSAKDRARAEAVVTEALEDYLAIEDILELDQPVDPFAGLRCGRIAGLDEAEGKAGELRAHWNVGLDPIPSMTGLLEAHGVKVIEADLPARFDGLACGVKRNGGRADADVVVTAGRTSVEGRRLTLAHELAHRVFRDTASPAVKVEKAVQRFAQAFLVPAEHLRAEAGARRRGVTYRELMRLKRFYGVPAATMLVRLRDAGILSAAAVEYAFRTHARPWRIREPEPIADEEGLGAFEKPSRFERLVWRAVGDELISPIRAAQMLKRPLNDVEREISGPRDR